MIVDIVFAEGDEESFLERADSLGFTHLLVPAGKGARLLGTDGSVSRINFSIVRAKGNTRQFFESKATGCIYSLESGARPDFIHHRNSGLNQVLCRLASKNQIEIGFSFNLILSSDSIRKAVVFGRMMQNARLCRKYGLDVRVASFAREPLQMRSARELLSFSALLKLDMSKVKEAFEMRKQA